MNSWTAPDGISCAVCAERFDAYHSHLTQEVAMDSHQADQMADHFAKCSYCRNLFDKAYPGLLANAAMTAGMGLLLVASFASRRRRR